MREDSRTPQWILYGCTPVRPFWAFPQKDSDRVRDQPQPSRLAKTQGAWPFIHKERDRWHVESIEQLKLDTARGEVFRE